MHIFTREDLHLIWEELQPFLEKSIASSPGWTIEYLQKLLNDGDAVVFAVFRDNRLVWMIAASLVNYPTYRAARVIAHAGEDFKSMLQFSDWVENWALRAGALEIEGWCADERVARLVRRAGYRRKFTIVSKDLRGKLQ